MKENIVSSVQDETEGESAEPKKMRKPAARSVDELPDGSGNDSTKRRSADADDDRYDAG